MTTTPRPAAQPNLWQGLLAVLLVLVPFHATLTVWLASNFGHYTLWRLWIEGVIAVLLIVPLVVIKRQQAGFANKTARQLWWLSVMYVALSLLLGLVSVARHNVNWEALGDGLILNLRL